MSSSEERSPELIEGQGPSAGLLAKVKEALKNPHLVWIGGKAPTPRQAAIICQTLGLTNEEEKQAKAVAVLKRDWLAYFENLVSSVSKTDTETKSRRKEMEVKWGLDHYTKQVRTRLLKLHNEKIKPILAKISVDKDLKFCSYVPEERIDNTQIIIRRYNQTKLLYDDTVIQIKPCVSGYPPYAYNHLKASRGWAPLTVRVCNKNYLNLAKKFARRYEKRSRQSVTIEKEY